MLKTFCKLIVLTIISFISCKNKHQLSLSVLNPDKTIDISQVITMERDSGVDLPMYSIQQNDTLTTIFLDEKSKKVTHIYWEIKVDIKDSNDLREFFQNLNSHQTLKTDFDTNGFQEILVINSKKNMLFYGFLLIYEKKVIKIELRHLFPY